MTISPFDTAVTLFIGGQQVSVNNPIPTRGAQAEYETVAASQTAQVLGSTGAIGDVITALICVVATAATAQVQIADGGGAAITVLPNAPGGGIGTYSIPLNIASVTGAWAVTTGAGVSVLAIGNFT